MQQIVVRRPPLRLNIVAIMEAIFNMKGNIIQIGILPTIDNAGLHRTCIVENFHERNDDNTHMEWLAYGPDLNPIKDAWAMLGRTLA